jgi:hypothetical protein
MLGDKSFAYDLVVERGVVRGRVALLLRSAETKPLIPDLFNEPLPVKPGADGPHGFERDWFVEAGGRARAAPVRSAKGGEGGGRHVTMGRDESRGVQPRRIDGGS